MSDSTPPPATTEDPVKSEKEQDLLQIKVTDNNTDVFFRVKRSTSLRRVIEGFCKRTGKNIKDLRFLYDGERISDNDTPEKLGMEHEDVIEALNQQVGGA